MALHAAPRAPRRRAPQLSHPTTAVLILLLLVLGLAGQCGSPAETTDSVPTIDSADNGSADNGGSVYYQNCAAAEAAGVTPFYTEDPGYSPKLDDDGDGVACEKSQRD